MTKTAENPVLTAADRAQAAADALAATDAANRGAWTERERLAAEAEAANLALLRATQERRRAAASVIAERAPQEIDKAGQEIGDALAEFKASITAGAFEPIARWMTARLRQNMWAQQHESALNTLGANHVTQSMPVPPSIDGYELADMIARALLDACREVVNNEAHEIAAANRHYVEGNADSPLPPDHH